MHLPEGELRKISFCGCVGGLLIHGMIISFKLFKNNFLQKCRSGQWIRIFFSILTMNFLFQGGPYHDPLHNILGAYACYRPDVGYVQGMSFLAATLLLNMDETDAFIAFSNLLNRPAHMAFFRVDQPVVRSFPCVHLFF